MTTRRAVLVDIITTIIGVTIGLAVSEGLRQGPLWLKVGVLVAGVVYFGWRVWRP